MMIELAHRDLHSVPDAAGVQIRCQAGSLWITLDHDTRDIVLDPGQSFSTPEHRRALIFALGPACVSLEPASGSAREGGGWSRARLQATPIAVGA